MEIILQQYKHYDPYDWAYLNLQQAAADSWKLQKREEEKKNRAFGFYVFTSTG